MGIEVTPEAAEVLSRGIEMAGLDPTGAGIRLRVAKQLGGGVDVQVEFVDTPIEGDGILETGGLRIFVDPALSELYPKAVVALEPQHERVVVRPQL